MPGWVIRAAKTFVQAALSFIIADISVVGEALTDWETGKHVLLTIGIGAVAAGISAAWNIILERMEGE